MQRTLEINGEKYVKQGADFEAQKKSVFQFLGSEMQEALQNAEAIIAGGSVLSQFTHSEVNDVDVYFRTREQMVEAFIALTKDWTSVYLGHSERSITLKDRQTQINVQFIYFDFFDNAEAVFEVFDFTVCMAAVELRQNGQHELVLHPSFLGDVASRTLHFNNKTKYPYTSLIRTKKYADKGYKIGRGHLLAIAAACANKKITTWEEAKSQLGGVYGYEVDLQIDANEEFTQDKLHEVLTKIRDVSYVWNGGDYEQIYKELTGIDYNDWDARNEKDLL